MLIYTMPCVVLAQFLFIHQSLALEHLMGIVQSVDRESGVMVIRTADNPADKQAQTVRVITGSLNIPQCVEPLEPVYVWGDFSQTTLMEFHAKFIRGKNWKGRCDPTGARLRIGNDDARCAGHDCGRRCRIEGNANGGLTGP